MEKKAFGPLSPVGAGLVGGGLGAAVLVPAWLLSNKLVPTLALGGLGGLIGGPLASMAAPADKDSKVESSPAHIGGMTGSALASMVPYLSGHGWWKAVKQAPTLGLVGGAGGVLLQRVLDRHYRNKQEKTAGIELPGGYELPGLIGGTWMGAHGAIRSAPVAYIFAKPGERNRAAKWGLYSGLLGSILLPTILKKKGLEALLSGTMIGTVTGIGSGLATHFLPGKDAE